MKNGALWNYTKFTGKHFCQSLFLNKVAVLRPATLLKKRLWRGCFLVNFVTFLRTPFLQSTSGRLLLYDFTIRSLFRPNVRRLRLAKTTKPVPIFHHLWSRHMQLKIWLLKQVPDHHRMLTNILFSRCWYIFFLFFPKIHKWGYFRFFCTCHEWN